MNVSQWKPFNTAPKIAGTRILAWCNASESESGIIEMVYRESVNSKTKEVIGYWDSVIDHPWQNACLNPKYWMESPIPPEPPLSVPPTISELNKVVAWRHYYPVNGEYVIFQQFPQALYDKGYPIEELVVSNTICKGQSKEPSKEQTDFIHFNPDTDTKPGDDEIVEGFCVITGSWGTPCPASMVPWSGVNHVIVYRKVVSEMPSGISSGLLIEEIEKNLNE